MSKLAAPSLFAGQTDARGVSPLARISAVIPTYNRAELVRRAVESVLAQTYRPAEVIVVDDGSTDGTAAALRPFGSSITYVRQENGGVASACNAGVERATGDWIAILGDDDLWASGYLERVADAIEATSGEAIVYFSDLEAEGFNQTVWEASGLAISGRLELRRDPAEWFMLPLQPMCAQAAVISRDVWRALGGYAETLPSREDTHLFLKLGFAGPACAVKCIGGKVTADADPESRLTTVHASATRSYCEATVWLYRDVLAHTIVSSPHHRAELRRRLAAAYWHRARLSWGDRRVAGCLAALARSLLTAPTVPVHRAMGRAIARPGRARARD